MNRIGIETRSANGLPIVALAGELDLSQVGVVEQALRGAERARPNTLVLDLSGLTFLDSSGLRLVLEADRRAPGGGGRLARGPGAAAGDGAVIVLTVHMFAGTVRVEVADAGPGFEPEPPNPSMYQTSGWGLYLVEQIADRWGVARDSGSQVWFELDRPAAQRAS